MHRFAVRIVEKLKVDFGMDAIQFSNKAHMPEALRQEMCSSEWWTSSPKLIDEETVGGRMTELMFSR